MLAVKEVLKVSCHEGFRFPLHDGCVPIATPSNQFCFFCLPHCMHAVQGYGIIPGFCTLRHVAPFPKNSLLIYAGLDPSSHYDGGHETDNALVCLSFTYTKPMWSHFFRPMPKQKPEIRRSQLQVGLAPRCGEYSNHGKSLDTTDPPGLRASYRGDFTVWCIDFSVIAHEILTHIHGLCEVGGWAKIFRIWQDFPTAVHVNQGKYRRGKFLERSTG